MRTHFKHLRFNSFWMIQRTFQSNGFWPLTIALWRFGNPLGLQLPKWEFTWGCEGFIPSHSFTLPRAWDVTLGLPSWLATLQAFALVVNLRLGLRHSCCDLGLRSWLKLGQRKKETNQNQTKNKLKQEKKLNSSKEWKGNTLWNSHNGFIIWELGVSKCSNLLAQKCNG